LKLAHRALLAGDPAVLEPLVSHREQVPEAALVRTAEMAALLCTYAGAPPSGGDGTDAWRAPLTLGDATTLLLRLSCNAHSVCDDELRPVGRGLYPRLACANHDCRPSAVLTFRGAVGALRAARPLAAGQEVTLSYIDLCAPSAQRRCELQDGYFFRCACHRCASADGDTAAEDAALGCGDAPPERCAAVAQALAEAQALRASARGAPAAAAAAALALADEHPPLPSLSALRTRVIDEAMRCALDAGDWALALRHARLSLAGYEAAYGAAVTGGAHPLLGLQHALAARLSWALGDAAAAEESYDRALSVLRVTHGDACALVGALQQSRVEAQAALLHAARAERLE
jgi:SET and MYND domain-containing protein